MGTQAPNCGACGEAIEGDAVWVVFGDRPGRKDEPWALHATCYPEGGKVTVQEPYTYDDDGNPVEGETYEVQRYKKVKAPNG